MTLQNAIRNLARCTVSTTTATTLPNATWTQVALNSFLANVGSFTLSSGGVVIPSDGSYLLQGQIFYQTSTANMTLASLRCRLSRSGSSVLIQEFNRAPVVNQFGVVDVSFAFAAQAEDIVFVDAAPYYPSGTATVRNNTTDTNIRIFRN